MSRGDAAVITPAHEEKLTLAVDVVIPAHAVRTVTALFHKTRPLLLAAAGGVCFRCGRSGAEAGAPIEAHHHPVERCWAEAWNWDAFIRDASAGRLAMLGITRREQGAPRVS